MIESLCTCGQPISAPELAASTAIPCPACQTTLHLVCAESLPDGAGAGDFDARLVVERGPHNDRVGDVYLLGGVAPIPLGKLSTSPILLPGSNVSRHHATLTRLDFGPSRWQIEDNNSTNGLWINDSRCTSSHELQDNDLIVIGEYELRFQHAAAPALVAEPVASITSAGHVGASIPRPAPAVRQTGRAVAYASPGTQHAAGDLLLGDADTAWVLTLRNASQLLVTSILANILANCLGGAGAFGTLLIIGAALIAFAGAWMLTSPEPGSPDSSSWFTARLALRVLASLDVVGRILIALSAQADSEDLKLVGSFMVLSAVPEFFLLLWYLRKLAIRIPNPLLAVNAMIVMIGLPALLLITLSAVFFGIHSRSPILLLLTGAGGLIGLLVFRIWYIILLVWFNKSFS